MTSSPLHAAVALCRTILVNLGLPALAVEALLCVCMAHPAIVQALPSVVQTSVQEIYRHFERDIIQFDPSCARYDPQLGYTLKPGSCTFSNPEFANDVAINSAGVRDDEASLHAPEIVVVGDSSAMGWGVEQEETFAKRIEATLGGRVLNASVSSYGTAREMELLDRLDTSNMKVLIVQYSDNDVVENQAWVDGSGRLRPLPRERYDAAVSYEIAQRHYYPGKYLLRTFLKVTHLETPEPIDYRMPPTSAAEEASLFLKVLSHEGRRALDEVQIVVFEVNKHLSAARAFTAELSAQRMNPLLPAYVQRMITIDTSTLLAGKDFYALDEHMNAGGHAIMANAITDVLVRAGLAAKLHGIP